MKVGIVLPTYNVECTVSTAIREVVRLMAEIDSELIIVDNHSVDGTVEVVKSVAVDVGLTDRHWKLEQSTRNMGYGASVKKGFEHFLERGFTHILVLHSDAQTDNYLLGRLLIGAALTDQADVILGSRFLLESNLNGYSLVRNVANGFFNWFTGLISGRALSDAGTAMVLLRVECLRLFDVSDMPDDWRFHPVLNMALGASSGLTIREIPMSWADSEAGSSVPVIRYGASLFSMLIAIWWRRIVKKDSNWWVPSR